MKSSAKMWRGHFLRRPFPTTRRAGNKPGRLRPPILNFPLTVWRGRSSTSLRAGSGPLQRSDCCEGSLSGTARGFSADFLSGVRGMTYDVPWTTFGGYCQWVLDAVRQTVEWPSAIRVRVPCPPQSHPPRPQAKSNALDNNLRRAILEMTDSVR